MKIALLGNVTLDFFAQDFRRAGHDVYLPSGFDAWRQEVLDTSSGLHAFAADAVLLVMDGGMTDADAGIVKSLAPVRVVAPDLSVLADETPGFWDERMRTLASMPFSLAGLKAIEDEFWFAVDAVPKKVLAVDADNTLWNGIVSEDGAAAVVPFVEFQKGLLALKERGVVLALLSKNDEGLSGTPLADALARDDVPLSFGDFAATGVNWAPKAGNLLEICKELNLGTDSVVFIDDNPHERAQMKAHLPEMAVPPFPADMAHPAQFLRRLAQYYFQSAGETAEDRARTEMYHAEASRRAFAKEVPTVQEYLKGLRLVAHAARAVQDDVPRLAQMAGKTNQFNATTLRRSADEISALVADAAHRVWTFRAGDAFGDMGLVCYVIYDCATARITDFVMSCRAMGRTLEHFALNHVRRSLASEGLPLAGIDCVPTAKNGPFRDFLAQVDLSHDAQTWYTAV